MTISQKSGMDLRHLLKAKDGKRVSYVCHEIDVATEEQQEKIIKSAENEGWIIEVAGRREGSSNFYFKALRNFEL